ncbi:hypothetical protein [Mycolicibacterium chubuense]|uniref:Uncharacterized protein n=1 Tax=Mycolicibacterium chubuense TaxID=1800 RepID=A0A0J6YTK0_MYCCU|nr:hypothetical protein [Mycolicibacterium chubuense]KMO75841.1 hypothetical protein MCHUDSM44219_03508 [Mycolicibacterium chubuense]SPX98585.1 Uncharacterised protein [Mycolicibacterium chubuense]
MSGPSVRQGALLRGGAAALLTTALTLAAHALGGGGLPSGPAVVQLLLVAGTVGATAAALPRTGDVRLMTLVLAAGQLAGHGILSAASHHAHADPAPLWAMAGAHLAAVLVGAALISAGDRLCRALSRVVRRTLVHLPPPVSSAPAAAVGDADQPLFSALVLVSSLSHRGPPVEA